MIEWDYAIFHWINEGLSGTLGDIVMPILRNKFTWIPLYLIVILHLFRTLKGKAFMRALAIILAGIIITDVGSSQILKPLIQRTRPCNNDALKQSVNTLAPCRQSFSMPSTHASNHFALAAFFIYFLRHRAWRKWAWRTWAAIVSIAQIYVGLHYPSDILAGALFGTIVAYLLIALDEVWKHKNTAMLYH